MTFYITSDFHLNHHSDSKTKGIIELERRNRFSTIQEHDRFIVDFIRQCLSKLDKDDTFYFLGDFGHPTEEIFQELKVVFNNARCNTIAIRGNHDHSSELEMMNELFNEVFNYPIYISDRIVLSHRPHVEMDESVVNISGHLHGSTLTLSNYMCASIHVNNYKPITSQQVQNKLSSLPKRDVRFLWEWFAPYYKFTQKQNNLIYDKNGNIDLPASRVLQYLNQQKNCENV